MNLDAWVEPLDRFLCLNKTSLLAASEAEMLWFMSSRRRTFAYYSKSGKQSCTNKGHPEWAPDWYPELWIKPPSTTWDKESDTIVQSTWKSIPNRAQPSTFGVQGTTPGVSAARLSQTCTPKREEERFQGCGTASGLRQLTSILPCALQPRGSGPPPWESHIYGTSTWGMEDGVPWHIRDLTKESPDTALHVMQLDATHLPCCKGLCQTCSPQCISIHWILSFSLGDPHYQEDQTEGTKEKLLELMDNSMFLHNLCHSSCPPSTHLFFSTSFFLFSLSLPLLLLNKFFFFASISNLIWF